VGRGLCLGGRPVGVVNGVWVHGVVGGAGRAIVGSCGRAVDSGAAVLQPLTTSAPTSHRRTLIVRMLAPCSVGDAARQLGVDRSTDGGGTFRPVSALLGSQNLMEEVVGCPA
jgi:hypothetical protein